MKKTTIYLLTLTTIIASCSSCKKNSGINVINPIDTVTPIDTSNKPHFTLLLRDKSLDTIQKYIQGTWKIHYAKGGLAQGFYPYPDSNFISFSSNRFKSITKTKINIDTTILWTRKRTMFGDSSYSYSYNDKNNYPYFQFTNGIFNDTLVTFDYGTDALFYYYTKIN